MRLTSTCSRRVCRLSHALTRNRVISCTLVQRWYGGTDTGTFKKQSPIIRFRHNGLTETLTAKFTGSSFNNFAGNTKLRTIPFKFNRTTGTVPCDRLTYLIVTGYGTGTARLPRCPRKSGRFHSPVVSTTRLPDSAGALYSIGDNGQSDTFDCQSKPE